MSDILTYNEWLLEKKRVKVPSKWKKLFSDAKIVWAEFDEAKELTFKHHDEEKMDPSTFKKIFSNDKGMKNAKYCLLIVDDHTAAIAAVGKRTDEVGGASLPHVPFIYELAAMREKVDGKYKSIYPGSGSKVMIEVIKKVGAHIWLQCLDSDAEKYWKTFAKKVNANIDTIGRTSWGTDVYEIKGKNKFN